MERMKTVRILLWCALAGAIVGGLGSWRYFRIPPDLRWPQHEALWLTAPYVLFIILSVALLLIFKDKDQGANGQ